MKIKENLIQTNKQTKSLKIDVSFSYYYDIKFTIYNKNITVFNKSAIDSIHQVLAIIHIIRFCFRHYK